MKRPAIPIRTRREVLTEFNHRCAICGTDRPHLHHIDENPENNDPLNIIPLCPNCHLIDQHNPTAKPDPRRLAVFREFKDPTILKPQFEPLFRRWIFLDSISEAQSVKELDVSASELVRFVLALEMGSFYGEEINRLVKRPGTVQMWNMPVADNPEAHAEAARLRTKYRQQLIDARKRVLILIVELLRYQKNW